jgi:hypothetical protein
MRTLKIAALLGAVLATSLLAASSATAKELVLSTQGAGPISSGEFTFTSTSGSFTFSEPGEELCPINPVERLKWKVVLEKTGKGYTGSVLEDPVQCQLSPGALVSLNPQPLPPMPWSIKLTAGGKGLVKGIGQKLGLKASFPAGEECAYGTGKEAMSFNVGTEGHPVPLEPGDPSPVVLKGMKKENGPGCPLRLIKNGFMYAVQFSGSPSGEEPVLAVKQ